MAAGDAQKICKVLLEPELFLFADAASSDTRAMLAAALPHACGDHSYQKEILGLATKVLQSAQGAAHSEGVAFGEEALKAEDLIKQAKEHAEAETKTCEAANADVVAKAAALEEQKAKAEVAAADDTEAAISLSVATDARDAAAETKASADAAITLLKSFEAGQLPEDISDLLEMLTTAKAEKTLLEAAAALLQLQPSERGEFDNMTLAELHEVLGTFAESLQRSLDEAELELKDMTSEALGCFALKEVEQERANAANEALVTAQTAAEVQGAAEKAAKAAVIDREDDRSKQLAQQILAQDRASRAQAATGAVERLLNPPAPEAMEVDDAKKAMPEETGMSDVMIGMVGA